MDLGYYQEGWVHVFSIAKEVLWMVVCFHWKPRSPGHRIFKPWAWSPESEISPTPLGWLFFESTFEGGGGCFTETYGMRMVSQAWKVLRHNWNQECLCVFMRFFGGQNMPIDYLPCVMGVGMIFASFALLGSIVLMYFFSDFFMGFQIMRTALFGSASHVVLFILHFVFQTVAPLGSFKVTQKSETTASTVRILMRTGWWFS